MTIIPLNTKLQILPLFPEDDNTTLFQKTIEEIKNISKNIFKDSADYPVIALGFTENVTDPKTITMGNRSFRILVKNQNIEIWTKIYFKVHPKHKKEV